MALTTLTANQAVLIVKNVVRACEDITKLNGTGYKFINLASGFIAHYNLNGFKDYYERNSLKHDILANSQNNQWLNFRPGDQNYEYYQQKAAIYNRIVELLSE
jgi:hypothetical protein